jgi:predicted DNA-binding transcriptional regulator
MKVDFLIMDRTVILDDMGVLKNDMVKGEGHWVGYVIDPEDK